MRRRQFIAGLGSAAAWPVVARAQQGALPVIGTLYSTSAAEWPPYIAGFRVRLNIRSTTILLSLYLICAAALPTFAASDAPSTAGPAKGWLIIHGGGPLTPEVRERFIALAGGPRANLVAIPTALSDNAIDLAKYRDATERLLGRKNVVVLHTRDRRVADSARFIEPLKHASGVWIEGGRQWRLADAYLGTAVEREIKAMLARGGVVFGSSAGATIQGSFLVRGAPATPTNPEGDNRIMMSPGHETGFGLLTNSAIDQHINTRDRERDLEPVIVQHPELLGIGIEEAAAIVVHGNAFFVVGGRVAIHDGLKHKSGFDYLSPGQAFNLKMRSVEPAGEPKANYPFTLTLKSASRQMGRTGIRTIGVGELGPSGGADQEPRVVNITCEVSLYSLGKTPYPARLGGPNRIEIQARNLDTDKLQEFTCGYQ